MPSPYYFQLPTQIIYGRYCANQIGKVAGNLGLKKVMIVTDPGVAKSGVLDQILPYLKEAGINAITFDEVEPNPTVQSVDKAAALYAKEGCEGVIAVGGGSPLDAGKAVGVLATNPGSASDYLGNDKVKIPCAPVIGVPTTAGTSAEITDVAVLSDRTKKAKIGVRSAYVSPRIALLDPALTLGLPPAPTRDSGLDTLTHAVESYLNINSWETSGALSLKAIELVGQHLRTAVHNGKDIEARDGMLMASLLAGIAFHNTKLCLVHAITGPMGGFYNAPHGAINAIILPHAMRFMLPGAVSKYVDIAVALGESVEGLSEREAAEKAVSAIEQLSRDVGLPKGLSVYGVKADDLPALAETIAASFMVSLSPRVAKKEDILEVCKASL
ncbi:MAG: iron-containing alcohol dehydrogenase [Anaerolineaceae bacterium]